MTESAPPLVSFVTPVLDSVRFLAEWRRACRKRRVSFHRLIWHEVVVAAVRRPLGLPP